MTEIIKVKKVGKHATYGEWLMVDDGTEKGKFMSSSEQVNGFLSRQAPCSVEIEKQEDVGDRKAVITRVKVLGQQTQQVQQDNSMNEFENPVTTEKPGLTPATNYKPSTNFYDTQNKTQESIVAQSSIKAALEMINLHNQISDTKIEPDRNNLFNNAQIAKLVYEDLMKRGDTNNLPDY